MGTLHLWFLLQSKSQSKRFQSCSKTQNPNFDSSMGSCTKCFFMMIYVIIDGFKKGNSMNPCLCKFPKVGLWSGVIVYDWMMIELCLNWVE